MKIKERNMWWDGIYWKVIGQTVRPGWRTGKTRDYRLECGHTYNQPASKPLRDECECIYCGSIWHWYTNDDGNALNNVEFALKGINPDALGQLEHAARIQGRLVRDLP